MTEQSSENDIKKSRKKRKEKHSPTLDTIKMVEDTIKDYKQFKSKNQLARSIPKQVNNQTLDIILIYLQKQKKIMRTKSGSIQYNNNIIEREISSLLLGDHSEFEKKIASLIRSEILGNIGKVEKTPREISTSCGIDESIISDHLNILEERGCVKSKTNQKQKQYSLTNTGHLSVKLSHKIHSNWKLLESLTEETK